MQIDSGSRLQSVHTNQTVKALGACIKGLRKSAEDGFRSTAT